MMPGVGPINQITLFGNWLIAIRDDKVWVIKARCLPGDEWQELKIGGK